MTAAKSGRKIIVIITLVIVAILSLVFLIANYTYSEGNRAGVVVKFSKKGYLLKTYEGELNMGVWAIYPTLHNKICFGSFL
jgi:hypothetical protein